ncbi:caspase family protein [Nostoc sp. CHAB 5715]|uniref:caspase family protein n=1 Tax=unclassified Nostoc TaxID=2593658 RepID=UPI001E49B23D|nr:caspase family protein [Nostoc sp. CHAB 5715]MCC5624965.1 caspase family protein [Nostoc sp. CHAB 5715]
MPKRALLIGIDTYQHTSNLAGCVADATAMNKLLQRNQDGKPNYECRTLLDKMENGQPITRSKLREACQKLFSSDFRGDILFYFSGHGVLTSFGGYLCTCDATKDDWGVPMQEIVQMASESKASDILIILDCCHSGDIANPSLLKSGNGNNPLAVLREDMTVLAASRESQVSIEAGGHGLFTAAVLDALEGGAADHMGWVTASSIYAYIERRFGSWDQRPVYKSYATGVTVVRECAPLIDRLKLYKLLELFPKQDYQYQLDQEYEPEDEHGNVHEPVNEEKVAIAQLLKEYRDAGLLKPSIPGEQLFWTARKSHTVQLTPRGREYWWLVYNHKI